MTANPSRTHHCVGLDVGGTHVKAVAIDANGVLLGQLRLDTGDADNAWHRTTKDALAQLESSHGPARAVGVSCPGIARPDGSGISWMIGRMASVVNFDFARHLGRDRVPVLNDALAAMAGEAWIGAARGVSDAILLTLGTGVGGAVLANGRLLMGHTGRAGHLGHITVDATGPLDICNTPGSIEYHIGNYSLQTRTQGRYADTADLVAAYLRKEPFATEHWLGSIDRLAAAIASMVNTLDPQRVIIGGGMIHAGDALFVPLRAALARYEWRPIARGVELVPAELGEWAGAIGAARNAMQSADSSPSAATSLPSGHQSL